MRISLASLTLLVVAFLVQWSPSAAQSTTVPSSNPSDECVLDGHTFTLGGAAAPSITPRALQVFGIQQCDPLQQGHPTLTVIDCSFATEHDRVYVYDLSGQMQWATRWQDAVNFQNSLWLFDVGASGNLALALLFQQQNGHDTAVLYDAPDSGATQVSVVQGHPQVSPPAWTAFIESDSTWLMPDGRVNENVHAVVDAPINTANYPPEYIRELSVKGQPKWEVGIVDPDHSGVPQFAYNLLVAPSPFDSALGRTGMQVNAGKHAPSPPEEYLFWPLLAGPAAPVDRNYFDGPYHISYDWSARKLSGIGLSGYPIEAGYHINTLRYFFRDRVNYADFENPMAYYDLWGNTDGRPELFIRMAYFGPGDTYLTRAPLAAPVEEINYSWNQSHQQGLTWNYKLGLVGRNQVDSVVQLGDFRFGSVPYDELPGWVTTHPWDLASFVADEGGGYQSAEGIYEWAPLEGIIPDSTNGLSVVPGAKEAVQDYILGVSRTSPASYFNSIRQGMRGEYAEPNGPVSLYASPIDHRLHLLGALSGVWNLGNGREVRYANIGGSYINHWSLYEGGQEQRSLWNVRGQLVLADDAGIRIAPFDGPEALFTTDPPVDNATWAHLGDLLNQLQVSFGGDDLQAMQQQFHGSPVFLPGATVSDLHLTADGFELVANLPASAVGQAPWTAGLAPGTYAIVYDTSNGYRVEALQPASLTVSVRPDLASAVLGEPLNVAVDLENSGGQNLRGVQVELAAVHGAEVRPLASVTVDSLAGVPATAALVPWSPSESGTWTLRARVRTPVDSATSEVSTAVVVREPTSSAPAGDMTVGAQFGHVELYALLGGLGIIGGLLALLALRGR